MFICILIFLSNDRFVSCIIMCVWVQYIALHMFMFYSIRNIDSTCTRPLDLIGDIYLYIIKLGCFLNICTYVTYTNQIIREKMSTLLPGTPFFIQVFHHTQTN